MVKATVNVARGLDRLVRRICPGVDKRSLNILTSRSLARMLCSPVFNSGKDRYETSPAFRFCLPATLTAVALA